MVSAALGKQLPAIGDSVGYGGSATGAKDPSSSSRAVGSSAGGSGANARARARSLETVGEDLRHTTDFRRLERVDGAKARFVEVPAAGHALHIERPEATARLLIDWLQRDADR